MKATLSILLSSFVAFRAVSALNDPAFKQVVAPDSAEQKLPRSSSPNQGFIGLASIVTNEKNTAGAFVTTTGKQGSSIKWDADVCDSSAGMPNNMAGLTMLREGTYTYKEAETKKYFHVGSIEVKTNKMLVPFPTTAKFDNKVVFVGQFQNAKNSKIPLKITSIDDKGVNIEIPEESRVAGMILGYVMMTPGNISSTDKVAKVSASILEVQDSPKLVAAITDFPIVRGIYGTPLNTDGYAFVTVKDTVASIGILADTCKKDAWGSGNIHVIEVAHESVASIKPQDLGLVDLDIPASTTPKPASGGTSLTLLWISLGAIAGVILIAGLLYWFCYHKKRVNDV